jgi:hypothetical protein
VRRGGRGWPPHEDGRQKWGNKEKADANLTDFSWLEQIYPPVSRHAACTKTDREVASATTVRPVDLDQSCYATRKWSSRLPKTARSEADHPALIRILVVGGRKTRSTSSNEGHIFGSGAKSRGGERVQLLGSVDLMFRSWWAPQHGVRSGCLANSTRTLGHNASR